VDAGRRHGLQPIARPAKGSEFRAPALWRLGSADTSLWPIWDAAHADDAARQKLTDLAPGPDLILEGDGDFWHIADTPKHGRRSFEYDAATDLFTDETYEAIPLSFNIDQFGRRK